MRTLRQVLHGITAIVVSLVVAIGAVSFEIWLGIHPSTPDPFIVVPAIVATLVWIAFYFLIENAFQPRPRNSVVKERLWPLWPI